MYGGWAVYIGRCEDMLPYVKDESVAIVFSSPPYNIGKAYEPVRQPGVFPAGFSHVPVHLHRVLRRGGWLFWQVGNHVSDGTVAPLDLHYHDEFLRAGFVYRRRLVWAYGHGMHCTHRFSGRYEVVLCYSKGDATVAQDGFLPGEYFTGVLHIPNVKNNHPEKNDHPCSFPVELVQRAVLSCSAPGETVMDVYGGSGSTAVAAVLCGRRGVCIEQDSIYVHIARTRLAKADTNTLRTRVLGTDIPGGTPPLPPCFAAVPARFTGRASLIMARADSAITLFAIALVYSDINVAVVCSGDDARILSAEAYVYHQLVAIGFIFFNRIVVSPGAGPYWTLLCFRRGNAPFNLDAVRVPQKYPGKKSSRTGLPSCNPLGKNPTDFWPVAAVGATYWGVSATALETAVCALSDPGDTVFWVGACGAGDKYAPAAHARRARCVT